MQTQIEGRQELEQRLDEGRKAESGHDFLGVVESARPRQKALDPSEGFTFPEHITCILSVSIQLGSSSADRERFVLTAE